MSAAKRGRPLGSVIAGRLGAWLAQAAPGDVYWTDRGMNGLVSVAAHHGRKVALKRFYAVSDELAAVKLVRIEVLS